MNIREEILKEHSKAQTDKITAWVGADKKRFKELIQLFLHDEYRVVQRAAWVVGTIGERHPELIIPYIETMVNRMHDEGVHVAVKRNVVRALQYITIPESLHGMVMNTCFDFLADPKETVAVRCFSMTVLANLSKTYPEIKQELRAIIEDQLEHEPTAGFRARAKKILNEK
jgi:hypothetical protein